MATNTSDQAESSSPLWQLRAAIRWAELSPNIPQFIAIGAEPHGGTTSEAEFVCFSE